MTNILASGTKLEGTIVAYNLQWLASSVTRIKKLFKYDECRIDAFL